MKTLIIIAHPDLKSSVINKRWMAELEKYPDKFTIHDLYKAYPEGKIDVNNEQRLVEEHGNLVFQFPIYWFSCPPLLKQWLDEVLLYGWAYGSNGTALKNRKVALAVSAGSKKEEYSPSGRYRSELEQVLLPFALTFQYCQANYRSFYAQYGHEGDPGENTPGMDANNSTNELDKSARNYIDFLNHVN